MNVSSPRFSISMPKNTTKTPPTQIDKVRALTNAPELSTSEFMFGDKKMKIVDLAYDDYLKFIGHLSPLVDTLFGSMATSMGLNAEQTAKISPKEIIRLLAASLPELACIVCNQTDPSITINDCKLELKTPFRMADLVMRQIEQNQIINEFADFFKQALPAMMAVLPRKQ